MMTLLLHAKMACRIGFALALFLLPLLSIHADPPVPPPQELLERVRANDAQINLRFTGVLRLSSRDERREVPFELHLEHGTHTYRFTDPDETIVLRLGENDSRLEQISGSGKARKITGAQLDAPVRGTDITYEDLSLKFLYWNQAQTVGQDNLMTRRCWMVDLFPGKTPSQYSRVRLWIDKTGGLMKAECYSGEKLVRRFEVRSVQKAPGGGYVLKTLRIKGMDERGRDRTPTVLQLRPL